MKSLFCFIYLQHLNIEIALNNLNRYSQGFEYIDLSK